MSKEYIEKSAASKIASVFFTMSMCIDERECRAMNNAARIIESQIDSIPAADVVEYKEVENLLRWAVLHDWTWAEAQEHLQRLRAKMDVGVNDGKID